MCGLWLGIFDFICPLDGVAPLMTDPPPISFTTLSKKKMTRDTWHVTRDMWHVTRDAWHVTCDMWNVTRLGGWTFSQNFSSLALTVCDLWYYEDILGKGWLTDWLNESMTRLFVGQPRLHRVCQILVNIRRFSSLCLKLNFLCIKGFAF